MRYQLCLLTLLTLFISSCDNGATSSAIKGGGGPKKPTESISPRFFLAHSALTDMIEYIDLYNRESLPLPCIRKVQSNLTYNCRKNAELPFERLGAMEFKGALPNLQLTNGSTPFGANIFIGGRILSGLQNWKIQISNGFFESLSSLEYRIPAANQSTSYSMTWDAKGKLSPKNADGLYAIQNLDLIITVIRRSQKSGRGQPELRFQYRIFADAPIEIDPCGRIKGQVTFEGGEPGSQLINSDPVAGLKPADGGTRLPWPACGKALQGLRMLAPSWLHPEP